MTRLDADRRTNLAELRRLLVAAAELAASMPETRPLVVNLADAAEDVDFLQNAYKTETR